MAPDTRGETARRGWSHRLFRWGVVLKALDGALEIVGGALLVVLGPGGVRGVVRFLTQHELSEDPGDLVANLLLRAVRQLSRQTWHFAMLYLLGHGLIKLWLASGLWREKPGYFPPAMAFLGVFVLYQGYRIARSGSLPLSLLTLLDLAILYLVWREYRALRAA